MKVVALFQIYLPHFLPRTNEWSAAPFFQHFFDMEGQRVNVHPRKVDEELFPNDVTFAYRRSAIGACNQFLYHCRVAGRDGEIGGLIWHYSFDHDRCYFSYPHTLIWFDAETKEVLRDVDGKPFWTAQSGSIRSPVRVPIDFSVVNASLSANQPKLSVALLVSSKEKLMLEQLQEGIVCLASACEVASTHFIQRKGLSNDPAVKRVLRRRIGFAEKRYHEITHFAVGRSLKTENPSVFTLLENAYKTRNSVVHNGELNYYDTILSQEIFVKRSMANDFFRSCEAAIDWIGAV